MYIKNTQENQVLLNAAASNSVVNQRNNLFQHEMIQLKRARVIIEL